MIKRILSLFLIVLLLISLPSCGLPHDRYTSTSFLYFDTVIELVGYTEDRGRFNDVADQLWALLGDYHNLFDIYNEYPDTVNLATVNKSVGLSERSFTVHKDIYELLLFGKEMHDLTDGKLNPAMGSVLALWRDLGASDTPRLPEFSDLADAFAHTSIEQFFLSESEDGYRLTVIDPYLTFDVSAIAKGYAAGKAIELLSSICSEDEYFLLNLGGMVCPITPKPGGGSWSAGIEYPTADKREDGYIRTVKLSKGALVTTASHLRYITVDNKNYGHVIDPYTLFPPEFFASVTVYCIDPALGDALSTALFCMNEADGRELIGEMSDKFGKIEAMWVYPDLSVSTTDGFKKLS